MRASTNQRSVRVMQNLTTIFSDYGRVESLGPTARVALDVTIRGALLDKEKALSAGAKFARVDMHPGELHVHFDSKGRALRLVQAGWRHVRQVAALTKLVAEPIRAPCGWEHTWFRAHGVCDARGDYVMARDVEVLKTIRTGAPGGVLSEWHIPKGKRFDYALYHVPSGYVFLSCSGGPNFNDLLEPYIDKWKLHPTLMRVSK